MDTVLTPIAFTLVAWWVSTGAVFGLLRLVFPLRVLAFGCVSVLALVALWGAYETANSTNLASVYCGFACAIVVWGWQEFAFLTGFITGPSRAPCPEGCRGFTRFLRATATLLWHEIAILLGALALFVATGDGANPVALQAYLVLWVMRISAKLNLFLGVRNRSIELLPQALTHLGGYFARARFNPLFPVSVTLGTVVAVVLVDHAMAPGAAASDQARGLMVATLLGLAILEHWFLVLPLRLEALWDPILRGSSAPPAGTGGASQPMSSGAVP